MSDFIWTAKKAAVALMLAEGYTQQESADAQGVTRRTVERWMSDTEFRADVDRLSVMVGIASCAGRLRIAHRAIRQRVAEDRIDTDKDVLDWLKFAQSETDGIKSGLAASLAELLASVAGSRGDGAGEPQND